MSCRGNQTAEETRLIRGTAAGWNLGAETSGSPSGTCPTAKARGQEGCPNTNGGNRRSNQDVEGEDITNAPSSPPQHLKELRGGRTNGHRSVGPHTPQEDRPRTDRDNRDTSI